MNGILYGVGVGPGDPGLMTLEAVRLIKEINVIAVPGEEPKDSAAYKTALAAVGELEGKTILSLPSPMTKDERLMADAHEKGARMIEEYLARGESAVYLTLGDPSIYSTFGYIRDIVARDGFNTRTVSGVTSVSAAAARLNISLARRDEPVHIIPAAYDEIFELSEKGTYVFMKPAKDIGAIKEKLKKSGRRAAAVTNCGMDGERVYESIDEIPDDAGYFTVIISKRD
ncbi:MAG: precorrin-2 C(20)-methyltransferase [Clostridia bacterium]|nr:precorrin-2 C(20)-methyltransferase [Clostridia bacterium]